MTVTAASFRMTFPEFADTVKYSAPQVDFYLDLGSKLMNAARWGNLFDFGQQLFAAHNLSLEAVAQRNANMGGNPGSVEGPQTSGNVDKVGYARNPGLAMDPKNGHWNLSTYGLRWVAMVRLVGAGPVYVGAPNGAGSDFNQGAWPGPYTGLGS